MLVQHRQNKGYYAMKILDKAKVRLAHTTRCMFVSMAIM